MSILALLCDPNPEDPLNKDAAQMYKENRIQFEQTAREWTQKYAK